MQNSELARPCYLSKTSTDAFSTIHWFLFLWKIVYSDFSSRDSFLTGYKAGLLSSTLLQLLCRSPASIQLSIVTFSKVSAVIGRHPDSRRVALQTSPRTALLDTHTNPAYSSKAVSFPLHFQTLDSELKTTLSYSSSTTPDPFSPITRLHRRSHGLLLLGAYG